MKLRIVVGCLLLLLSLAAAGVWAVSEYGLPITPPALPTNRATVVSDTSVDQDSFVVTVTELKPVITVANGELLVNGEAFFIRGIGYEAGCRPGELPWKRQFDSEVLAYDFSAIRAAESNWRFQGAPLTDDELRLARAHGLWVIQGLGLDWSRFWGDPVYQRQSLLQVGREVRRGARHPNILYYLVMNEPSLEKVLTTGLDEVDRGFRLLQQASRAADSTALLSFSNFNAVDFLDTATWDVVSFNSYPYFSETVRSVLGYRGYTEWLARRSWPRAFVTSEFGLSVSPDGPGRWGYGGNTLQEQAEGVGSMYRWIAMSGAVGACPFMWVDGWWKSGNENAHSSHPEEWFGLNEVTLEDRLGKPRPVVAELAEANRLLLLSPAPGDVVTPRTRVRVVATAEPPEARFAGGEWISLRSRGFEQWEGEIETTGSGLGTIELRAGARSLAVPVMIGAINGPPGDVQVTLAQDHVEAGTPVMVRVRVHDFTGRSLGSRPVYVCLYNYRSNASTLRSLSVDASGEARFELRTLGYDGVYGIAAGVDIATGESVRRIGDQAFLFVQPSRDPGRALLGKAAHPLRVFDFVARADAASAFAEVFAGDARVQVLGEDHALVLDYQSLGEDGWIYAAQHWTEPLDLSPFSYISFFISSSETPCTVKVMFIDQDGERWCGNQVRDPAKSPRQVVWDLAGDMMRDAFDGVKNGNGRFDRDRIAGLAVAVNSGRPLRVRLARMEAWR